MGRMTRAKAAEVADNLHVDEDVVLSVPSASQGLASHNATAGDSGRQPLSEITPNNSSSDDKDSEKADLKKSTRGRKRGKKGTAKDIKNNKNLAASTSRPETFDEEPEVAVDENEAVPSPASEAAADDLNQNKQESVMRVPELKLDGQKPHSPAVRLTRRQLAKIGKDEAEPKILHDDPGAPVDIDSAESDPTHLHETASLQHAAPTALDAPASPLPSAMPNVVTSLRKDTPTTRSTSNKENITPMEALSPAGASPTPRISSTYDALETAAVQAATPPAMSSQPSPKPIEPAEQPLSAASASPKQRADPFGAMDDLEDAVEQVSAQVPSVRRSPQKVRSSEKSRGTVKPKKAAPVVKTTKASQARMSLAHPDKQGATRASVSRPRPSSMFVQSGTSASKSDFAKRVASDGGKKPGASGTDGEAHEKKAVAIPHSKPRPVSLSFPTPPPPPKSKKEPTSSTFQLPGEAVAAKLKAAREARLAKEAEEAQKKDTVSSAPRKPSFKARPVPASLSKAPPNVRQTNASKARESLMNGKPAPAPAAATGHQRANSVATGRPPSVPRSRVVSTEGHPKTVQAKSGSEQPLKVAKRPSTAMASVGKSQAASASSATSAPAPAAGPRVPSKGTAKGKEVFNRAALAKDAAEKEKREKEEAAKKARIAAAERGRQASREWAEKQRLKKLGLRPAADTETKSDAAGVGPVSAEVTSTA